MKQTGLGEELEKEKEKLDKLVEEAIKKGVSLSKDEAVMVQNRKVDELVIQLQLWRPKKERQKKMKRYI